MDSTNQSRGFALVGDAGYQSGMNQRPANELRPTTIEPFPAGAPGSVVITAGKTKVLCTASVQADVPRWIKKDPETGLPTHGWVTAEYSMLPGSTPDRKRRGTDGRSTEIQRLIGRALRAAVDLDKMPGLAITCDCDVLVADGGTRTAAITGAYVALGQALNWAREQGRLEGDPVVSPIAAISVGIIDGVPTLDLDYPLDVRAEVDMNVAMNGEGQFIEVQGTGEQGTFDRVQLDALLDLAQDGIKSLMAIQQQALS
ncbi:ribonuclease PH [Algisphaera agarilytica]|nr:ribonuclease PH [Algisphaera agarilytica]